MPFNTVQHRSTPFHAFLNVFLNVFLNAFEMDAPRVPLHGGGVQRVGQRQRCDGRSAQRVHAGEHRVTVGVPRANGGQRHGRQGAVRGSRAAHLDDLRAVEVDVWDALRRRELLGGGAHRDGSLRRRRR